MKAENRWNNGVWLEIRAEFGEYIIGTKSRTTKVRRVRRKESERTGGTGTHSQNSKEHHGSKSQEDWE